LEFSYKVGKKILLDGINLPLSDGEITLITGVENTSLMLLGGLLAGLFPIDAEETIDQIAPLIRPFTGTLEIYNGAMPHSAAYMGPDPERHLIFSRVDEEIQAQTGVSLRNDTSRQAALIDRFDLPADFLRRKISSLSGGEKMKLGLALTFAKDTNLLILHGVLPWLDERGKEKLITELRDAAESGKTVVILEEEIHLISRHADNTYYFDGTKLVTFDPVLIKERQERVSRCAAELHDRAVEKTGDSSGAIERSNRIEVLRFDGVNFGYDREKDLLTRVSFVIESSGLYALIGENGAGKSTIAQLILRLYQPAQGKIFFLDRDLSSLNRKDLVETICYLGQFPEQHITLSGAGEYKRRAGDSQNLLSLNILESLFPDGKEYPIAGLRPLEMKFLQIAASITSFTKLIILDEPTWGLDKDGEVQLLELLTEISRRIPGVSFLYISHDKDFLNDLGAIIFKLAGAALQVVQR
jgi:energy-coupling factor transport system ATP-binding protein